MSRSRGASKQKKDEQGSSGLKRARTSETSRRAPSDLPHALLEAGNTAVSHLLGSLTGGRPLDQSVQAEMEQAFGADFGEVRIHDDATARARAGEISAEAFTHGDDIYLADSVSSPGTAEGKRLLAHELAHVVQQRRAGGRQSSAVGEPGDRFETDADQAASHAAAGRPVQVTESGAPPAVQRQPDVNGATRTEVEQAITSFLERAKEAQGGRTLDITTEVRQALEMLATAGDDPGGMRLTNIQALLDNSMTPRDPADLARRVAQLLPDPLDRAALRRLSKTTASKPVPTSKLGRLEELKGRTAAGSAESEQERTSSDKTRPRNQREEIADPFAPGVPSAQKRAEHLTGFDRTIRGEKEPRGVPPIPVDVLRVGRFLKGVGGALKEPRSPKAPAPRAQIYPEISRAIQELVSPDALIPAEVSGRAKRAEKDLEFAGPDEERLRRAGRDEAQAAVGAFEDAQDVAGRIAALLDVAHQQGATEVDLRLVGAYNNVKYRRTIYAELNRIALLVRNRLPHRAKGVARIRVYFGSKLVTSIPLD